MMTKLLKRVALAAPVIGSLVATQAQAAVPVGVQTVFTDLATDFGTIVGYGWVLFLVVIGGTALFGIVKKVFNKAK